MIVRRLLIVGMLSGVLAGLIAALFARLAIEPTVDLAIAFEAAHNTMHAAGDEPELVSRAVQKGAGLIVAATCYGAALGGIFALVFATLRGRVLQGTAQSASAWMAFAGFVAIALVPALKYPSNPPAVGLHETIQLRTATFFACIALSVTLASLGVAMARRLTARLGVFDARLAALAAYGVAIALLWLALPTIDEVPANFPASLLWSFRIGALSTQAILWAGIGIVFGYTADRVLRENR